MCRFDARFSNTRNPVIRQFKPMQETGVGRRDLVILGKFSDLTKSY